MTFDIDKIVSRMQHKHESLGDESRRRYFHAKIQPDSNQDAEEELKRELKYTRAMPFLYYHITHFLYSKEQFNKMEILGQV